MASSPFFTTHLDTDTQNKMIQKGVWQETCPLSLDRLRKVCFLYHTFEGSKKEGEIVVLDAVAPYVQLIFKGLLDLEFPLKGARSI